MARRMSRFLLPLAASWLIAAIGIYAQYDFLLPHPYLPALPRVDVPYAHGSDVVSVVPHLFRALVVGSVAVLVAEIAKILALGDSDWRRNAIAVLLYQVVLFLDVFRGYAQDWFVYFLSFLHLIRLEDRLGADKPPWLPIPSPWVSFAVLLMLSAYLMNVTWRRESSRAVDVGSA